MRQIHFKYKNETQLKKALLKRKNEINNAYNCYFHIFSSNMNKLIVNNVINCIKTEFNDIQYIVSSSAGNFSNSTESSEITITCNIFELPSSKFEILHFDFNKESMSEIAKDIIKYVKANSWIKGIEFYHTVPKESTSTLCDKLAILPSNIHIFGGITCSTNISSDNSYVASSTLDFTDLGLVCIFFGGDDLYIDSVKISGWKPIGRTFRVTKAEENLLIELSGMPAFEVYKKYLDIINDEYFFLNVLDFPMMYEHNGTTIVRVAAMCYEDGSLRMPSDMEEGKIVRLSYGDPKTIINSIYQHGLKMQEFKPQVMHMFSCAARKEYWSDRAPTYELNSIKNMCDSSGFFSHGEFLREHGFVNQHNLTLVIASFREGKLEDCDYRGTIEENSDIKRHQIPLAARMATFVRETSFELEKINSKLALINSQLQDVATTDALTGLDNRLAFDDKLSEISKDKDDNNWNMYMLDVNGLKYINDTFGHLAGDELIKSAGNILHKTFGKKGFCYRIGGDEFVVLINMPDSRLKNIENEYEKEIEEYNKTALYHLTIAKGKSKIIDDHMQRRSISDWKMDADLCMYRNKASAHNSREVEKDENLKQLISCLITAEEAKDSYTAYHSDRVKKISETIARRMGLTEETVNMISDAAALHDIGKVGISDSVLLKPGRLTDEEFAQIKEHTTIGAKILIQSNYMQEFVQIVLHHHERYDGFGYPNQLAGDDIPLGARIIAIADSIDAMTSKRVYRDALPLSVCKEEIEKNIGKMYDPAIAKITLDNWGDIEEIVMSNPKNLYM